ncbi:MAG: hypothetical protein ACYTGN_16710 [Planctomycetota bacterium]|jgi:hypothetical protein
MRVLPLIAVAVLAAVAAADLELLGDGRFRLGGIEGTLRQRPGAWHVLDARTAAVLFDNRERPGYGDAVAYIDKGKYVWHVALADLYDEATVKAFHRTLSGLHWLRSSWVDEPRRRIVLVTTTGQVCELDLKTGVPTNRKTTAVLPGIRLPHARRWALEIAAELKVPGTRQAAEPFLAEKDLGIRLRAAVAVARDGGPKPDMALFREAIRQGSDMRYAIAQMAVVYGKEGLEPLKELAGSARTGPEAIRAIGTLGPEAAPVIMEIMTAEDTSPATVRAASVALSGQPGAIVGVLVAREIDGADDRLADQLLAAAIHAKTDSLHDLLRNQEGTLVRLLRLDTPRQAWLADHFARYPTTDAVPGLIGSLERNRRDRRLKKRIVTALRACTGLDCGDDPKAWRKATRR